MSSDAFHIYCPSCGTRLKAQPSWAGRQARCPSCQTPMLVPSPPGAPPVRPVAQSAGAPPAQAAYGPQPPVYAPGSDPPSAITVARVILFIEGAFAMLAAVVIGILMAVATQAGIPEGVAGIIAGVTFFFALLYFFAASGLLKGRRALATFLAILSLLSIPVGTVLGVIVLVCIYSSESSAWARQRRRR